MPVRATKRGDERTPLDGNCDVLICGASFAGLAVARELTGSGAEVMIVDRYEIGERQTSACGIPTDWLRATGMMELELQRFGELVVHTPHGTTILNLPYTFSTFNYREMCELMWRDCDATFETAKVNGRAAPSNGAGDISVETDRGVISAPLVVDALGWRRVLANGDGFQPPDAPLSRGLEVHPPANGNDLEIWVDRRYVPAGYGWSFPAGDEVRIGIGSYDPRFHVREPTERLTENLGRESVRYQGNWIPHKLRPATEGGVLFVGDSAGHCIPVTAEGIRTAIYFGIAAGRELRAVVEGRSTRAQAIENYAAFSDSHERKFRWMLRVQRLIPRIPPRLLAGMFRIYNTQALVDWSFKNYLDIAHPDFASAPPTPASAHDQVGAGEQQDQPDHALGRERDLVQTE